MDPTLPMKILFHAVALAFILDGKLDLGWFERYSKCSRCCRPFVNGRCQRCDVIRL